MTHRRSPRVAAAADAAVDNELRVGRVAGQTSSDAERARRRLHRRLDDEARLTVSPHATPPTAHVSISAVGTN